MKPNKPHKPRITKTVSHPNWGGKYNTPAYDTDDAVHHAMAEYADKLSEWHCGGTEFHKKIHLKYKDGSEDDTEIERVSKTFSYKVCYQDEEYEETYYTATWEEPIFEIKSTSLNALAKKYIKRVEVGEYVEEISFID